jgi:hypothetical protein
MVLGAGDSAQGVVLTEGNAHVTSSDGVKSDGVFNAVKQIECYSDGDIEVTWPSGLKQSMNLSAGWVNPIICKSVKINSGIWNMGYWN